MSTVLRVLERLERSRATRHVVFVFWCAITLFTIAHHEAWRDEADSWLMARDNSLADIWRIMRYAGTPMLLYVVEKPLIALGLPYTFQWLANWPFAAGAVWLLLYRSRLSFLSCVVVVFSFFFVFEYAVVTRAYAMTVFFILLVCVLHARRHGGNFVIGAGLFCAANATAFGLFFACAYGAVAGVEMLAVRSQRTPRVLAAQAIGWLGILVALAQLLPEPVDGQGTQTPRIAYLSTAFGGAGLPVEQAGIEVRTAATIVMLLATLWLVRKNRHAVAMFALFTLALSYLFYAKHVGYVRHWGFYLVAAIAARVVACGEEGESEIETAFTQPVNIAAWLLTLGIFGAWCVKGVIIGVDDDVGLFTNAKVMAQYLVDNNLEERDIAGQSPTATEAVLAYLPHKKTFFYPSISRVGSNMIWDKTLAENGRVPFATMMERIEAHDADRANVLLLWTGPIPDADVQRYSLALLHMENETVVSTNGEKFWLYGFKRADRVPRAAAAQ